MLLAILSVFVGVNLDTFIFLLLTLDQTKWVTSLIEVVLANETLWLAGAILGITLIDLLPNWMTGFLGIWLLILAICSTSTTQPIKKNHRGQMFLACLALGGDNLAFFVPWAGVMKINQIELVTVVFGLMSILMVGLIIIIRRLPLFAKVVEQLAVKGTRWGYGIAGLYVIWMSGFASHLWSLINRSLMF
ncbi:MAG TPA: hypothetical protein H9783_07055 [Candidatus Limosilactobacillus faecipullorum]|nr:hypothetical protein [Candidatus Limosilactobacillus faecipullorum]